MSKTNDDCTKEVTLTLYLKDIAELAEWSLLQVLEVYIDQEVKTEPKPDPEDVLCHLRIAFDNETDHESVVGRRTITVPVREAVQ